MESDETLYQGLLHLLKTEASAQEFKKFVSEICNHVVQLLANQNSDKEDFSVYIKKLQIDETEASELQNDLKKLLSTAIYESYQDKESVQSLFPESFHKDLRNLLSKCILDGGTKWRALMVENQVSYPKLRDFKWQLNRNDEEDLPPTCVLYMKKDDNSEVQVEMNKNTVNTMLRSLSMIRDQLTSL